MRKNNPDYLGHNELITDRSGNPYQYFHYTAWGESFAQAEASQGSFSSSYRFNAKELDAETGNYYYGARYYHPKWSVWLSVDPLAGESPNQTPYHFVSNNPVMRIDPDGLTDYELDKQTGKITMVEGTETTKGPDRLIAGTATYDDKGNLTSENYRSVKNGVIDSKNLSKGVKDPDGLDEIGRPRETQEITELDASGLSGNGARDLFEFIADNSEVEYSLTEFIKESDIKKFISSSHGLAVHMDCSDQMSEESGDMIATSMSVLGYSLRSHTHSHPGFGSGDNRTASQVLSPSSADKNNAAQGVKYWIYSPRYQARRRYNGSGSVDPVLRKK